MIRKNMKLIIGLIIGIILPSVFVYAANSLSASSISIDKSKMNKVENSNLQSALDYLYGKSEKTNMITIESGAKHETQTYLGIAYLDPTNLENKCTSENSVSTTGTKTGCMKWYIYKDLGDSYKMILDHNTTAIQPWNTTGNDGKGTNVEFKANNGNLAYDELMKLVSESSWVVTPDLIEASEVAEIVGYNNFTNTKPWFCLDSKQTDITNWCSKPQGTSKFAWVFDNTNSCTGSGCNTADSSNYGYWTNTAGSVNGSSVWYVRRDGDLDLSDASHNNRGLRPVITISKTIFS